MKLGKKLLAIVLCLALLASVPVSMAVSAEGEEAAKEALLEAWAGLGYEEMVTIGYSGGAQEIDTLPAEVKDNLTAEQLAAFGSHYVLLSSTKKEANMASTIPYKGKHLDEFHKIAVSAYGVTSTAPYFVAWYTGSGGKESYPASTTGYKEYDYTGWISLFGADAATLAGFKYGINSGSGPIYIGSFVGYRNVYATDIPAADAMSAQELYAAAAAVDTAQYTIGVEAFEEALEAFYAVAYPEEAALINAWKGLQKEEMVVVGYPAGATAIEELPDSVKSALTAEQLEAMGPYFRYATPGTNCGTNSNIPYHGKTIAEFDRVMLTLYTEGKCKLTFKVVDTTWQTSVDKYPYVQQVGFTQLDVTSFMQDFNTKAIQYIQFGTVSESGYNNNVYIGSVVGYKTANETDVPALGELNAKELYEAAKAVDLTAYKGGQEAFEEALVALYPVAYPEEAAKKAAILEAWAALAADTKTVTETALLPPDNYESTTDYGTITRYEVDETTDLGVDNALLGTHYSVWNLNGEQTPGWGPVTQYVGAPNNKPADVAWNKLYFYAKTLKADGSFGAATVGFQLYSNGEAYSVGNWKVVNINTTPDGADETRKVIITNGPVATIYLGSILGEYTVNGPAVPENAASMTYEELVAAAKAADTEGFAAGAALENVLYAIENPEEAALINAWKELKKEEMVTIGWASGAKLISELPAEVKENLTEAQIKAMGDRYVEISSGEKGVDWSNKIPYMQKKLPQDLHRFEINVYATGAQRIFYMVFVDGTSSGPNSYPNPESAGYYTFDMTASMTSNFIGTGKKVGGIKYGINGTGTGNTVYFGSVVGYRNVAITDVPALGEMSLEELYEAAKAVDLTVYNADADAVAAFEAAVAVVAEDVVKVETEAAGGEIEVDDIFAAEDEVVTITIAPEEGKVLKAGSLKVYDEEGNFVAFPARVGFQSENGDASQYTFVSKGGKYTVKAEFVNESELATPNQAILGVSVNTESAELNGGMRSVYRMPVTRDEEGTYWVTFNGETKAVDSFGILLCSEGTLSEIGELTVDAEHAKVKNVDFTKTGKRYDVANGYQDVSVMLTNLNVNGAYKFYSRGYIVVDGVAYYNGDADGRIYNDIVTP